MTLSLNQCVVARAPARAPDCGPSGALVLYTANSGGATRSFTVRPAAGTAGADGAGQVFRQQCVLVAAVIDSGAGTPGSPAPMALARLSFSTIARPALEDSSLQDLSWTSATDGWALAAQPCTAGTCARLAHTSDGGMSWQQLPDPPALLPDGSIDCSTRSCVSNVLFASTTIGYLCGPTLLMTTDGGHSWQAQPGLHALAIAGGTAFRVAYDHDGCPGPCQPRLQQAAIGSAAWHTLINPLVTPGQSGSAQIVASGAALLLGLYGNPAAGAGSAQATVYRSSDDGASWHAGTDPCPGRGDGGTREEDVTDLTAAPDGFFAGLCTPRGAGGTFVVTSTDAGRSSSPTGALPKLPGLALLAAASSTTLAVSTGANSGTGTFTTELLVSTDAGKHWRTAATDSEQLSQQVTPAWLGFQTPQSGRWIGSPHTICTTHDGGQHWTRTAFH